MTLEQFFISHYNPITQWNWAWTEVIYHQQEMSVVREHLSKHDELNLYIQVSGKTFDAWWKSFADSVDAWNAEREERRARVESERVARVAELGRFAWGELDWRGVTEVLLTARKHLAKP